MLGVYWCPPNDRTSEGVLLEVTSRGSTGMPTWTNLAPRRQCNPEMHCQMSS
jgi:hypothetical protein